MKYLYNLLIALLCSFAIVGCGDDDFLEIDSLSADGDEFFCNQKVKLWMCVRSSDLWHTDYEWTCDGGILTQPQGLNEMTWKAPSVPGTYTITCKAKVGGVSQVRSHKMYVSSYYFEKFEKALHSMTLQNNSTSSLKKEANGNQYLQIRVNSNAEVKRYIRRGFDDNTLVANPFSTRIKMGFESNVPNTQRVIVGEKDENAVIEYRWNLRADESNEGAYLNQIRMMWYPGELKKGEEYPEVPQLPKGEDGEEVPPVLTPEGTMQYNVQLVAQYTGTDGKKTTKNEYHFLNTMNIFKAKEYKTVSMGLDQNKVLTAYIDGVETLSSNIVQELYTEKKCVGGIYVNNWEIYYINGNGGRNIPLMYFDDAYASNTEILK